MGNSVPHQTYSKHHDGYWYSVTFESDYFAEGASRYAFCGRLESDGPKNGMKIVTKVFKKGYAKHFDQWTPDLTASKKAIAFAVKFNDVLDANGLNYKKIEFKLPLILRVSDVAHFKILGVFPTFKDERYTRPGDYVAVEEFIEGEYVKFNSNGGYEDDSLSELILAFCHWTWYISGQQFMICDLQGIIGRRKYILTDPAVHSAEQIYGDTDLGIVDMEMVMGHHRCNDICRKLKLDNPMRGRGSIGKPSTAYRFSLTAEEKLRNMKKRSPYFDFNSPLMTIGE